MHTVALRTEASLPISSNPLGQSTAYKVFLIYLSLVFPNLKRETVNDDFKNLKFSILSVDSRNLIFLYSHSHTYLSDDQVHHACTSSSLPQRSDTLVVMLECLDM